MIKKSTSASAIGSDGWMRFGLLPLAIALIVITTMIPVALRHPSLVYVDFQLNPPDVTLNLLLYVPLGVALADSSFGLCLLSGFALSLCAEILQLGYVNRGPSPVDVLTNTLGTVAGFLLMRFCRRWFGFCFTYIAIPRRAASLAIAAAIFGLVALVNHRTKTDFSNWSRACHLAIGNELSGDRSWEGELSELAIYSKALDPLALKQLSESGPDGLALLASKPIFHLKPADDTAAYGRPILSAGQEQIFFDELVHQSQLSVLVWMRPRNVVQTGPARIVTYSTDASNRNFTLSQSGRTLNFRLRTPVSGANGTNPDVSTPPLLYANRVIFAAAVYDGAISRIYAGGTLAGYGNLGARTPAFPESILRLLPPTVPIRELDLNIAEFIIAALLAVGFLGMRQSANVWSMGLLAGLVTGMAVWILAVSEPWLGVRILLISIAGGLTVALAFNLAFERHTPEADLEFEMPAQSRRN